MPMKTINIFIYLYTGSASEDERDACALTFTSESVCI